MRPRNITFGIVLAVATVLLVTNAAQSKPKARPTLVKPQMTEVDPARHYTDVVGVQFQNGLLVRLRNNQLTDLGTGALRDAQATLAALAGGRWERVHKITEEQIDALCLTAERNLRQEVTDLNLSFYLHIPEGMEAGPVCDLLNQLDAVDLAFPVSRAMPAPVAPDYEPNQGYLDPATGGIDAECMWLVPGGTGNNVQITDIEYSWNFSHLDLPPITLLGGTPDDPFNDTNHGTAVMGEISALRDGMGVTGICYDSTFFVAAAKVGGTYSVGAAISVALGTMGPGDIILIEQQTAGPHHPGGDTQDGLVPSEWELFTYLTIIIAVGNDVIVVEAAGNGSEDLDHGDYNAGHAPFLPGNDSGAIIVGAGAPPGHPDGDRARLGFSNWGATVDLQGWGGWVFSTGYGSAYSAEGQNLWYTNGFGGTSSASPIVTGACATLQSAYIQAMGTHLTPAQIKYFLQTTGSPQQSGTNPASQNIGPRPDAAAAFAMAYPDIDCDGNGIPDPCDEDCNANGVPDDCDIDPTDPDGDGIVIPDCNNNGVPDDCDIDPTDPDGNGQVSPDCQPNGVPDECDIADGTSQDCQPNGVPDECDIADGTSQDCQPNGVPDECDIADGTSQDCQPNGVPDECDIANGTSEDCNKNGVPDECDIANGTSQDCQPDGIPDECQLGNCLNQYAVDTPSAPYSDLDCDACGQPQLSADNFVIDAPASLTGVRFWGGYWPDDAAAVLDRFTIVVRTDAGLVPGAALATYGPLEADTKLDSGLVSAGTRIFEYTVSFSAPLPLAAGTYWVEIYNDTTGSTDSWYWQNGTFDAVHTLPGAASSFTLPETWTPRTRQLALVVYCDEPDNDCNNNGIPDECELGANDCNNNGIPDDCETKPEYDPTVAIPHKQCQDADFVCPDILYLGSTTPLGPGTSLPLTCSFYFGVFDTYYAYRPAWDGVTFIRVEGPPTQFLYAVYEGCPAGPQNLIRCNESNHFELVFDAKKGETYYIRIAGTFYTYGDFEMELVGPDCLLNANDTNANGIPDECECLQDVDGNGVVDMADYIAVLIAFGPCAGCPEDVDGDGNVDESDAIEVFLNQGPCPFPGPMPPAQALEQQVTSRPMKR